MGSSALAPEPEIFGEDDFPRDAPFSEQNPPFAVQISKSIRMRGNVAFCKPYFVIFKGSSGICVVDGCKVKEDMLEPPWFLKRTEEGNQACPRLYGITVWVFVIGGGITWVRSFRATRSRFVLPST